MQYRHTGLQEPFRLENAFKTVASLSRFAEAGAGESWAAS
jgi:hypothetical protein